MKKRIFGTLMAVVLFAAALAGCGNSDKPAGEVIVIGGNFELSGAVSSYGNAEKEGAELAIKEINAAGGVNGKQLKLVTADNKSDAAEVTSVASKLITQDKAVALIGPATSGATKAAIAVGDSEKVAVISPSATSDDVTAKADGSVQEYGFRVCFQDSFQGGVMAQFAKNNLSATKAVIIGDNSSDYAKGLSAEFKAKFGGEIVAEESYTEKDQDFSAIITNIKAKAFDVIFIPGYYAEAGLIIKQAREAGITQPIIGADGFDSPELANLAGANNLNDVYFSAHYSSLSTDEVVTNFMKKFNDEYKKTPNAFNALGYDTVYLLADAIERAGEATPEKIKDALEQTKDFKGVTGSITIDEKHNAVKSATVIGLKEGKEDSAVIVEA